MNCSNIQQTLRDIADPEIAEHSQRFFKTSKGEYGEGDRFLGIRVPQIRKVAREFKQISLKETKQLLQSEYHEERLCALIILVSNMKTADPEEQQRICKLYLENTKFINNWDLVDTSAQYIVGLYLSDKDRTTLYELAQSENLWERRIAIMSTFHFIKNDDYDDTLKIAELLLNDAHDLIHKATGWMLREVGKRDLKTLEIFLDQHNTSMPRTMLRYAIEKMPEKKRQYYLA